MTIQPYISGMFLEKQTTFAFFFFYVLGKKCCHKILCQVVKYKDYTFTDNKEITHQKHKKALEDLSL